MDPSKTESDYDKLVKSYQELYKLYQDTNQTLYTTQQYLMRLAIISKGKDISDNGVYADRLKDIIQKSLKIHPQTLKKINNQLTNTINNNNSHNNIIH